MDDRDRLAFYPFVVVRIACRVCSRNGGYRLARLAREIRARNQPARPPRSVFPMTAYGERRCVASEGFQPVASTCRTSNSLCHPICHLGS